jgi:outer membrane protein assembly factor BamB
MGTVSSNVTITQAGQPAARKPIRLWPGVVAVVLQWLLWFGGPKVAPEALLYFMGAGVLGAVVVLVWWLFFSRVPRLERWTVIPVVLIALFATSKIIDKSIAGGMMGMMFPVFSILVATLILVVCAAFSRLSTGPRRAAMLATILIACGGWACLRTNGISGSGGSDFAWRWSKTPEERLLAQPLPAPVPVAPTPATIPVEQPVVRQTAVQPVSFKQTPVVAAEADANWPGFRGPNRDSIVSGTHIKTDWSASPPVQLWRRQIGPGWSSFAVRGDLFYTQEQRGDDELVTCYNASTGKPVWAHRDAARFWESNAGAGPRATPTLSGGRLYTFGATGILNALDAATGAVIWSRNAATDTATKVPGWAFASSPLVTGDMVIVATGGELAAYDSATGAPRWTGPQGGDSYSSPHLATLDGTPQILLLSANGVMSVGPPDGNLLWKYAWPSGTRIMQPAMPADGGLLFSGGDAMGGNGLRRISVAHSPAGWTTEELWTSRGLKPSFNDFVIYDGHAYGFDGTILACIDLKDGARKWKGGRYGAGQLLLLRDQGLLLVTSEEGELALVKAAPDQFTELARFPAMEGKTWNHPVLTGDRLLVRNGTEMAAFRLATAAR